MLEEPQKKKHIITIAGKPGSGKSTTAKVVAVELAFSHFSSGDLFRQIVAEHGFDLLAGNLHAEENKVIDETVDRRLVEIGQQDDNLVIDSRMAWHWMPQSFKVYLDLDVKIAAKRILANMDEARAVAEHIPTDPDEYAKVLDQRLDSEIRRYDRLYNANPYNLENYNLVINTSDNDVAQATKLIVDAYNKWIGN